jgi:hypothetical protein
MRYAEKPILESVVYMNDLHSLTIIQIIKTYE